MYASESQWLKVFKLKQTSVPLTIVLSKKDDLILAYPARASAKILTVLRPIPTPD
jgi:hypothetical protein